jgi:hypothetical protein
MSDEESNPLERVAQLELGGHHLAKSTGAGRVIVAKC